ncbi:MAG: serine/threonine-protein kinase [Propionibacteriaceae bacterium]|nr:serine/threonine-protein kinase [Propionibacteriaceae bacterium]
MQKIGRYRLVRRLGAGSFATVWLGRDDDLDVDVAVKILAENWSTNADVRSRFLAEARLMRRIRDERIVRVYDIGTLPDDRPYFVMDYCDAGSLADLRRNPTDPVRTLRLCAEACRALDVLHRHQVVHRDVTPGNLLLDANPDGSVRVLLADLGVAKEMVGQQGMTMTAGTPSFMAPEQATSGALGAWSDIYAMACVTQAVLTGRTPFAVKTVNDVMHRDGSEQPEPVAASVGAPPELDALLRSALALDPAHRPRSAQEMGAALDRIADAMGAWAADSNTSPAPAPRPPQPRTPSPQPQQQPPAQGFAQPFAEFGQPSPVEHQPAMLSPTTVTPQTTPAWQFWTLVSLIAVLVFIGTMFLTLIAL